MTAIVAWKPDWKPEAWDPDAIAAFIRFALADTKSTNERTFGDICKQFRTVWWSFTWPCEKQKACFCVGFWPDENDIRLISVSHRDGRLERFFEVRDGMPVLVYSSGVEYPFDVAVKQDPLPWESGWPLAPDY